jgi:hypothetical protein
MMDLPMLPQRSYSFVTPLTDSRVWESFELREGDVIVSTPPKCGTTWMQALVLSLIFGKPGMDVCLNDFSIWLDPGFRDQSPIVAMFNAQTHRRCIKTHTPLDGIEYDPSCLYLAVYRHPIDAHFSMRRHTQNMKFDLFDGRFSDDPSSSFSYFLEDTGFEHLADGITLASLVHHYRIFRSWEHLPNVHMFHYADMRRDLPSHTRQIARVLGYDYSASLLDEIAASLQFERMQTNARKTQEHSSQSSATFKDPAAFFDSATSRKWEGKLSDEEMLLYQSRLFDLLSKDDAYWLENGGALPSQPADSPR